MLIVLAIRWGYQLGDAPPQKSTNSKVSPGLANPELPTPPQRFADFIAWFAVRSEDPKAVATAIELQNAHAANWEYGISRASELDDYRIFVTPPAKGWVLVVGMPVLFEADAHARERTIELSKQFGEAQFFASVRTSDSYTWVRASKGKLIRLFYESDGQRRAEGKETEEEKQLGFKFSDVSSSESPRSEQWEPDEQSVLQIAGRWSIDPTMLSEMGLPPSLGLLGDPSASYSPKPIHRK